jgi:ABC-type dipeptide/oligopeptide/nickel transport system ATPase component
MTSAVQPLVEITDLCIDAQVQTGTRRLVSDASMTILPGHVRGLIGESGSGKTTLARSIIGLLEGNVSVASGEIRLNGKTIDTSSEQGYKGVRGSQVGTVFQRAAASLDPLMKIGAQIVEVMRVHDRSLTRPEARLRAEVLLGRLGFHDAKASLQSYPHELSGGMQQRAAIAMAIAPGPRILIADESTSALDVTIQAEVIVLLRELAAEGLAVLFVTHDLMLARSFCTEISVMQQGVIVESGDASDVVDRPTHPYTKALLGAIPVPGEYL